VLHSVPRFQNSIKVPEIFSADWVKIGLVKPAASPAGALQYLGRVRHGFYSLGLLRCIVQRMEIGQQAVFVGG